MAATPVSNQARPRRSVLYMPGSNARALEKAKTLPADALILDLEDAVAPDMKATARDQVCAAVQAGGYGGRELIIRRSEEHTSELPVTNAQLVCRLLLEKKTIYKSS